MKTFISFSDYMNSTEALFKGCKVPKRAPDFVSRSGSKYWEQENSKGKYVIRLSDHWCNLKEIGRNDVWRDCNSIASCQWHIKATKISKILAGKCYLDEFRKIN